MACLSRHLICQIWRAYQDTSYVRHGVLIKTPHLTEVILCCIQICPLIFCQIKRYCILSPYQWLSSSRAYLPHFSNLIMRLSTYRPHKFLGFLDRSYYCIIVFYSSIFISLFMTDRSQIAPLLYYIITISELHVQFESSTRFIEIHSILTILFNND